MLLID